MNTAEEETGAHREVSLQIRPGNSRWGQFLVPAVGGTAAPYGSLAWSLNTDRAVFALEDPGLDGAPVTGRSLYDLALTYLREVRRRQPEGPVVLLGWSVGGAVALEMARIDQNAPLVVMLDTVQPDSTMAVNDDVLRRWLAEDVQQMGIQPTPELLEDRFPVFAANVSAFREYEQAPVPATRVVSLLSEDHDTPEAIGACEDRGWEVEVLAGNHYTMLQQPHVADVAATIDALVEEAIRS